MKTTKLELNILSHLIHQEKKFLKKHLPTLRKLSLSPEASAIVALLDEYVKTDPGGLVYDYVFAQITDVDYFNSFADAGVGTKLFNKQLSELVAIQEESSIRQALSNTKGKTVAEVLSSVKSLESLTPKKPKTLDEIMVSRLEEREIEKDAPSTGYPDLDDRIRGFLPGHVYTMTGETNVGKTQIACNFAYRVAKQNKRVLYFALEPDNTVIDYLASIWSRRTFASLTTENYQPQVEIDVYTKDQVKDLREMVQIVEDSERYNLIIIDHFGYFTVGESSNKTQLESNAMKVIAQLAKKQRTAIVSIVHPRKPTGVGVRKRVISMNDISGSAAFKQDSTEVLLVSREFKEDDKFGLDYEDNGYILVAKQKSGTPGAVPIRFVPGTALILDSREASLDFVVKYVEPEEPPF